MNQTNILNAFEPYKEDVREGVFAELTPVDRNGKYWIKRDDLFTAAGVNGGKVRTCYALALKAAQQGFRGLTTAGSRSSPQVNIVANIARALSLDCVAHTPKGALNEELLLAQKAGAHIIQHKAGYNSVIVARSKEFAEVNKFYDIPFGMECAEAIYQTCWQVKNIPDGVKRIVMPVGSGMSLCGVATGLLKFGRNIPLVGVKVGADPLKRLQKFYPHKYRNMQLIDAQVDYHEYVSAVVGDVVLDPVYEAKCKQFLEPDDLLWIVGIRQSYKNKQNDNSKRRTNE